MDYYINPYTDVKSHLAIENDLHVYRFSDGHLYITNMQWTLEKLDEVMCNLTGLLLKTSTDEKIIVNVIETMTQLTHLQMENVGITGLNFSWLTKLCSLQLTDIDAPQKIDDICRLSGLTKLALNNCRLDCIPEQIRNLVSLKSLSLCGCNIKEIPEWISVMGCLEHIDVVGSLVTELPSSLFRIRPLQLVAYSGDKMNTIIESCRHFFSLKGLSAEIVYGRANINELPQDLIEYLDNEGILCDICGHEHYAVSRKACWMDSAKGTRFIMRYNECCWCRHRDDNEKKEMLNCLVGERKVYNHSTFD